MFQSSDVTASGLQEAGVMFAPQLRLQVSRTSGIQLVRARTKNISSLICLILKQVEEMLPRCDPNIYVTVHAIQFIVEYYIK